MIPLRTTISLVLAAVAGLCLPAGAAAIVPPGNSAATQYTEAFPTAGGPKATRDARGGRATPADVLGAKNARKLEESGAQGREAAELAAATAPGSIAPATGGSAGGASDGRSGGGGAGTPSHGAGPATGTGSNAGSQQSLPKGSSALDEVIGQATGSSSSSSGELGLLLPLGIAAVAIWSILFLARRRKHTTA